MSRLASHPLGLVKETRNESANIFLWLDISVLASLDPDVVKKAPNAREAR
jgi:hypothetical protein